MIVGGWYTVFIVNIDECIIEKRIKDESLRRVRCFLKLRDNNTILCGCDDGIFCFYDMNTEEYKITKDNNSISDQLLTLLLTSHLLENALSMLAVELEWLPHLLPLFQPNNGG